MNARDLARVEAIKRVGAFGATNAADWTPKPPAAATPAQANAKALFAQLNTATTGVIARLDAFSTGQQSGAAGFHGGTASKGTLRDGLMRELKGLNEGAAAIGLKLGKPDLIEGFRMPHGVSDETLAARARSFAGKAGPLEQEFILLGEEDDFIAALEARVSEFEHAKDDKGEALGDQVGAGKGLTATIQEGLTVMAQLVVLLKNLYREQPDKLAALGTASHVQRAPKRKAAPVAAGAPVTVPA